MTGRLQGKRHNRRAFLRAAGTAGFALPFLEGLVERSAFAQNADPRFGLFICTANGVVQGFGNEPDRFWPSALGPLSKASLESDSPDRCTGLLADHAERLLIVRNLRHAAPFSGNTAASGLSMCLTGLPAEPGDGPGGKTSGGVSADWVIARASGGEPLTTYAGPKEGFIDELLSFSAPGVVTAAEKDPYQVYLQLTGLLDANVGHGSAAELSLRRRSANDLVRDQLNSLLVNRKLSQADRARLELHLDSIRDIEMQLPKACSLLDEPEIEELQEVGADGFIEDVARLQMRLVGLAFSCNLVASATLQWGDGEDGTQYIIDGETVERFSFISNRVNSNGASGSPVPDAVEKHAAIDRIRMSTFKAGLDYWSELSTPAGSLLNSAFAMWTCSKADGPTDASNNLPLIIAGSPGGLLKQGQYLDASDGGDQVSMARLLTSLIEVCGVDATDFAEGDGGLESVLS